jgi:hypothetical protein
MFCTEKWRCNCRGSISLERPLATLAPHEQQAIFPDYFIPIWIFCTKKTFLSDKGSQSIQPGAHASSSPLVPARQRIGKDPSASENGKRRDNSHQKGKVLACLLEGIESINSDAGAASLQFVRWFLIRIIICVSSVKYGQFSMKTGEIFRQSILF